MKNFEEYGSRQWSEEQVQNEIEFKVENSKSNASYYKNLIASRRMSNFISLPFSLASIFLNNFNLLILVCLWKVKK
jgi:hypothetical protein